MNHGPKQSSTIAVVRFVGSLAKSEAFTEKFVPKDSEK